MGDHPLPGANDARSWFDRIPMYLRILIALGLGVAVGSAVRAGFGGDPAAVAGAMKHVSDIVLKLLTTVATPLIFIAIVNALVTAHVTGRLAVRMLWLLMFNTVVAILVGLAVANLMRPGVGAVLPGEPKVVDRKPYSLVDDLLGKLPVSTLKPLVDNDILGVICVAVAIGLGLRVVRARMRSEGRMPYRAAEDLLETGMHLVMVVLHWVIALVPLAVFAVVVRVVATQGVAAFQSMAWFVLAVLTALAIQAAYYLVRLRLGSRIGPWQFLKGGSDALLMAFSTASSAATMPVTYACMKEKLGISDESASMGVMVGGTFNHDGTALYEAMAALFISQVIGQQLGFQEQLVVVVMSVVASVGAAGIPEAGLVTMLAVFTAVKLPTEYIPLLLTVDWFLDRCRTTINVMGDMTVTCMLDGRGPPAAGPAASAEPAGQSS